MRTGVTIVIIAGLVLAGAAAYLVVTTPRTADSVQFPLSAEHRALLSVVPPSADAFALIPSAALLHGRLTANPVTRDVVAQWSEEHELPRPWMLGGADIVAWRSRRGTAYAVRLDRFRALLIRGWLALSSNAPARWDGSMLIMNDEGAAPAAGDLDEVLSLAAGLPEAEILLVQRSGERGAFPPIGRPAVTSARIDAREMVLVSRARATDATGGEEIHARFPRGALLSATFMTPPRILGDLNRLLGTRVDALVNDGGAIALYGVEFGTLLPRPRGLLIIPADPARREMMKEVSRVARMVGETRDTGNELLVSFDRESLGHYSSDTFVPATWPATRWSLHLDPARMAPLLRRLGDSAGLRIVAPRLYRGARDLRRWIGALEHAESLEASDSVQGGVEELRVRIRSK